MSRSGILFIKHFSTNAKFILNDKDILEKKYNVELYTAYTKKNFFIILALLKQFFHILFRIHKYKLFYVWFADYHSFVPVMLGKLFNKKSVIVVGGYDATCIPEINMGLFCKSGFKKWSRNFCAEYSLKNCSLIIPVDSSLIKNSNTYIYSDKPGKPVLKDGVKNFIPGIKTVFKVIRLGYDPDIFKSISGVKENTIVSAGYIPNENEFKRKGFDVLVDAASEMPHIKFILIGLNDYIYEILSAKKLKNLELYKSVSYEKLIELYSRSKVYSQLSLFEGMPSAVCEAMLCGCIPVGSDVNGIPDIIGDCGIIVKEKNQNQINDSLLKALTDDKFTSSASRGRIMKLFALKKRESELISTIEELIKI